MARFAALFVLCAVALVAAAVGQNVTVPPVTVPQLNVRAYAGRWFAMYLNPVSLRAIGGQDNCVTADYTINFDGTIGVFNAGAVGSVTAGIDSISGSAIQPNPSEPGKLAVTFFGVPAEYWIVELGEIIGGLYQWAVVTDSQLAGVYVLARNAEEFDANYRTTVLPLLRTKYGFQFNSLIRVTQQALRCPYARPPFRSITYFFNLGPRDFIGSFGFTERTLDGLSTCGRSQWRQPVDGTKPAGTISVRDDNAASANVTSDLYRIFKNERSGATMVALNERGNTDRTAYYVVRADMNRNGQLGNGVFQSENGKELLVLYRLPTFFAQQRDAEFRRFINTQLGIRIVENLTAGCDYPPITVDPVPFTEIGGLWFYMVATRGGVQSGSVCPTLRVFFIDRNAYGVSFNKEQPQTSLFGRFNVPWLLFSERYVLQLGNRTIRMWVFEEGPLRNGRREYIVLGTPLGRSVMVLARDVTRFNTLYRADVLETITVRLGVPQSRILFPTQDETCNYPQFDS